MSTILDTFCWGFAGLALLVSLFNLAREPKLFAGCLGGGVGIWIALSVLNGFQNFLTTGGFIVGAGLLIANVGTFMIYGVQLRVEESGVRLDMSNYRPGEPEPAEAYIETVDGEVMPDYPELPAPKPRWWMPKQTVDPVYCPHCDSVTWQTYRDGEYVCDHRADSQSPYQRSR